MGEENKLNKKDMLVMVANCSESDDTYKEYYADMETVLNQVADRPEGNLYVDVKEIFNSLESGTPITIDEIVEGNYQEVTAGNTYNYGANVNHDIQYYYFADMAKDIGYAIVKIHRMGDIRANYTDLFVVSYESASDYWFLEDIRREENVSFEIDGLNVFVEISSLRDTITAYIEGVEDEIDDIVATLHDKESVMEDVRDALIENGVIKDGNE